MGTSQGGLAQLGEHLPYKQRVSGSSPLTSTMWPGSSVGQSTSLSRWGSSVRARSGSPFAAIAQLVERILGKDEVSSSNLLSSSSAEAHSARYALWVSSYRGIAQLVEQRSPKPRAEGSNPSTPAIHIRKNHCVAYRLDSSRLCIFSVNEQEVLLKEPASHITVRTDRYMAVQPHECKDSQQLGMLKYPAATSLLFVMEHFNTGLPTIRQQPSLEFPHW